MMYNMLMQLFQPEMAFMRLALLVGVLLAPACGIVGTLVVVRRISSLAGAIAHAALGGVGLAIFLQRVCGLHWFTPILGAVCGALAAAVAVWLVCYFVHEREDTIIGIIWTVGMSIGLLLLSYTPGYVDWQGYLFGNILLLSPEELYFTIALNVVVVFLTVVFYQPVLTVLFDSGFAKLRGLSVKFFTLMILLLTALTIVLLIKMVGIILVIALLTLPSAIAGIYAKHLSSAMWLSGIIVAVLVELGLMLSYLYSLPTGPIIVMEAAIIYALCRIVQWLRR